MQNKSGFANILIIIAVLVALAGAGYFYINQKLNLKNQKLETEVSTATTSPVVTTLPVATTSNATAGWKTYRNDKYGFKYPQEFYLNVPKKLPNNSYIDEDVAVSSYKGATGDYYYPRDNQVDLSVAVLKELPNSSKTVQGWLESLKSSYNLEGVTDITIDGEKAIKISKATANGPAFGTNIYGYVLVIHSGLGYEISYRPPDTKLIDTINQILSTFKFTK